MKTITVLSDTHGYRKGIDDVDAVLSECDFIFHLGDTSADGNYIRAKYPNKTFVVNGNCDLLKTGEDEIITEIENVKILACHGHAYSVKTTLSRLAEKAKNEGCKLALYGHTHEAREDVVDGVTLVNPGAGTRYGARSYLYLVINCDKIVSKIVKLG